ncbi:MAG TPA: oxygenase MpaB family protein [Acidobacteriaceae bacterium]|nr:oxygenase MpaB family protein [Acidobacteriaceae bacterium]
MADRASPNYVSFADSQSQIASLAELPGDPQNGFFGPESITWKVNRESAVFLGAGRAALLQLAHPWVAAALAQHSNLLHDAVGRFHSTFRVIYTMLFGTRAQAMEAARQLYRRHTGIRGELLQAVGPHPKGEHYEANEVGALVWVYATLVDSAILAYEVVLPPLADLDREHYYAESKRMAALFGIPAEALPPDWSAFARYTAEMFASPELSIDSNALALGKSVLSGVGTWLRPPHWYRALTAFWMPPRLRTAFQLPFDARAQDAVRRTVRRLPRIYLQIPASLRFVGPFHEAAARLRGRSPGLFTRRSNCFWMGQPRLLYSDLPG